MSRCIITVLNNDGSIASVELKCDCIIQHDKGYDTWRCTKLKKNIEEIENMLENPSQQNYISRCKYPKESRSYHFCVACSDKAMCKESVVIKTYRD